MERKPVSTAMPARVIVCNELKPTVETVGQIPKLRLPQVLSRGATVTVGRNRGAFRALVICSNA